MTGSVFLGQFEQMVMLTLMQLGQDAHAITIRRYLAEQAGHKVTRGALYRTLDRLESKGYIDVETDEPTPERGGYSRRRFFVTKRGLAALKASHTALHVLSRGLDTVLRGP